MNRVPIRVRFSINVYDSLPVGLFNMVKEDDSHPNLQRVNGKGSLETHDG